MVSSIFTSVGFGVVRDHVREVKSILLYLRLPRVLSVSSYVERVILLVCISFVALLTVLPDLLMCLRLSGALVLG